MVGGIYLIKDEDVFVEMTEQRYDSEEKLQGLFEKYSLLIAGDQINNDEPRLWLPVAREKGVPYTKDGSYKWYLDPISLTKTASRRLWRLNGIRYTASDIAIV